MKSLGPSNDDPPAVQLEMRAARLALESIEAWNGRCPGTVQTAERWGWEDHGAPDLDNNEAEAPGYATAWSWDISRPIADQLAETAADDAAASRLLAFDPDGAAIGWAAAPTAYRSGSGAPPSDAQATPSNVGSAEAGAIEERGNDPESPDESDGAL